MPIIPNFRFGPSSAPVSLDTGSSQSIGLFQSALRLPALRNGISLGEDISMTGARGTVRAPAGTLRVPIGFGPYRLQAGQAVHLRSDEEASAGRVANVGNRTFRAMGLSLLLDYKSGRISFMRGCGP